MEKEYQYYGIPQIDEIFKDDLKDFNIKSHSKKHTAIETSFNLRVFADTCEKKLKDLDIDMKYVNRSYIERFVNVPIGSQKLARHNAKTLARYYTQYKREAEDEDFMAMYESIQEHAQRCGARPY